MRHFDFIVVGTDCITNDRVLFIFLRQFHSNDGMGFFQFFRPYFSNIVKQTRAFGLFNVKSEFGSHNRTQVGNFTRVLQ